MREVYQFLKDAGIYFIATCEGNIPHVRIYSSVAIYEDRLYIATTNDKPSYRQMMENPKIEICIMKTDETWLRLSGTVVKDSRVEARIQMLKENPELRPKFDENDGRFEVFYLKDATGSIHSHHGLISTHSF